MVLKQCTGGSHQLQYVRRTSLVIVCEEEVISYGVLGGRHLTGFNRIAIHFPCVGSWMAPGQGSLWLI